MFCFNVNQTRTEKINLTLNTFNLNKCYITGHYHLLFSLLSLIQCTITFSTSPIKIAVWPNFNLHMFFPLMMSRWFSFLDFMLDSYDKRDARIWNSFDIMLVGGLLNLEIYNYCAIRQYFIHLQRCLVWCLAEVHHRKVDLVK